MEKLSLKVCRKERRQGLWCSLLCTGRRGYLGRRGGGEAVFIYMWMLVKLKINLGGNPQKLSIFRKKKNYYMSLPLPHRVCVCLYTCHSPCLCMSVYMPQSVRMRKSEDNLWELVLPFHHVDPRD